MVFVVIAFSGFRRPKRPQRSPQHSPTGLQGIPKTTQEGPKTAQEAPKTAQKAPRTAPMDQSKIDLGCLPLSMEPAYSFGGSAQSCDILQHRHPYCHFWLKPFLAVCAFAQGLDCARVGPRAQRKHIVIIDCGTSEAQPGRLDRTNRRSSFTLRVVAAIARETVVRGSFSR